MSSMNRREFHRRALAATAGLALASCQADSGESAPAARTSAQASAQPEMINSTFAGVVIGTQSYSFRDRTLEEAIAAMKEIGIGECELYSGHIERRNGRMEREKLREWRLSVSLDEFEKTGQQFRDAGIDLYAYNYSFRDDFSDAEIERGFEMAKVLGAKVITASSNVTTAQRVDPFAKKHQMRVGMHNHSNIRENEFATPGDFAEARKGMSDHIAINLDIGHFTAANFDPLEFIEKHHGDILTLHIKDRKRNQGDNVPFGEGDTKIVETLRLLRDKKYQIPANIEYEYGGEDTVREVRKCFAYCKKALLS